MVSTQYILKFIFILFIITSFSCSCKKNETNFDENQTLSYEEGEELLAGKLTLFSVSQEAFGRPVSNISASDNFDFGVGNSLFRQAWVTAPASTTLRDGLGPLFNSRSCGSCHFKDGRGEPLESEDGSTSKGFLMRISQQGFNVHGEPVGDPVYGDQFQTFGIAGVNKEGEVTVSWSSKVETFTDGYTVELRVPSYQFTDLQYGPFNGQILSSPRVGQQVMGLGFLEAISEATILEFVSNQAINGKVSGKANYVWNVEAKKSTIGRFGWKANQPTLRQQIAAAFNGDLGITSSIFPSDHCSEYQKNCSDAINGGEPELKNKSLNQVVLYTSLLTVPARRNFKEEKVLKGKELFRDLECNSCHVEKITTGMHPTFSELSNITIRPFTDLLLHDMGDGLADNRPDFLANGNEWRTQPLWGLGLIESVNNHTFLLHDGRARNIMEAVLWHGGEAEDSKQKVLTLNATQRENLLAFLNSL